MKKIAVGQNSNSQPLMWLVLHTLRRYRWIYKCNKTEQLWHWFVYLCITESLQIENDLITYATGAEQVSMQSDQGLCYSIIESLISLIRLYRCEGWSGCITSFSIWRGSIMIIIIIIITYHIYHKLTLNTLTPHHIYPKIWTSLYTD